MKNPNLIKVVGHDPSMNNWGIAEGTFNLQDSTLVINCLTVINPVLPTGKQTRQNSKDVAAATQLYYGARKALEDASWSFVEVPHGSQSSRSMASYGMCAGVLGSLRAEDFPMYQLSESEVKLAALGKKSSTKQEMIDWAVAKHPEAPWPTYTRNGTQLIAAAKAEHMADAVAAIHAGIQGDLFKSYVRTMTQQDI